MILTTGHTNEFKNVNLLLINCWYIHTYVLHIAAHYKENNIYTIKCSRFSQKQQFVCVSSCPRSILWSYIRHKKDIIAPVGARQELRNERNIKWREADCESDPEDWWVEKVNPHPYLSLLTLFFTNYFYCFSNFNPGNGQYYVLQRG